MIDIHDLNKVEVFSALYSRSKVQRMGHVGFAASGSKNELDFEEAERLYNAHKGRFDYVNGRVMKVDLTRDSFDPFLYDRDNEENAAQGVIDSLRSGLSLDIPPKEPWKASLYEQLRKVYCPNSGLNQSELNKFDEIANDEALVTDNSVGRARE
jgi:hypothetical protein